MEKLTKLIKELYPGYCISCIEQFYRPSRGWQTRVNRKDISTFKPVVAYKKTLELGSTKICVRLLNKDSGEVRRPDILICGTEPQFI